MDGSILVGLPHLRDSVVELESEKGWVSSQFPEFAGADEPVRVVRQTSGLGLWHLWAKTVSGDITVVRRESTDQ